MRHWRKMTWVLWGWTILCAIWLGAGIASSGGSCHGLSHSACVAAGDIGKGIGVTIIIIVWLIVFLVLSLIWFMTRNKARQCPHCGRNVKTGLTVCQGCGYDYVARTTPPSSPA
ncbi:MAG: hypothetical protein ACRENX_09620 [Candidatus Dormibacteria bacterium]